MATNDSELIKEARQFAGYTSSDFSDSEVQEIIDIAKEELRADFGDPEYTFWSGNHNADRALFWFSCLGLKVKAGELGAPDIGLDEIRQTTASTEYQFWQQQLRKRRSAASTQITGSSAASRQITRDEERTYSFERP